MRYKTAILRIPLLSILLISGFILVSQPLHAQTQAEQAQIRLLYLEARQNLENNQWNQALEKMNQAQSILGRNALIFEVVRTQAYLGLEDVEAAENSIQRIFSLNPGDDVLLQVTEFRRKIEEIKESFVRFTDPRDGQTYELFSFISPSSGNEVFWFAENLNASHYRDGTPIPQITDNWEWVQSMDKRTAAWSYYDNDPSNGPIYGKLYNWYAVANYRGLCPDGWRVPSDDDWKDLELFLGMSASDLDVDEDNRFSGGVGGKLKQTGTQYWHSPNEEATNEIGFSGLPGGWRTYYLGSFIDKGVYGLWWTSTLDEDYGAPWFRGLNHYNAAVYRDFYDEWNGYSVRCVR